MLLRNKCCSLINKGNVNNLFRVVEGQCTDERTRNHHRQEAKRGNPIRGKNIETAKKIISTNHNIITLKTIAIALFLRSVKILLLYPQTLLLLCFHYFQHVILAFNELLELFTLTTVEIILYCLAGLSPAENRKRIGT